MVIGFSIIYHLKKMYDLISFFLYPLIQLYKYLFLILFNLIGKSDISIIVMSFISSSLLLPLLQIARRLEGNISLKIADVNASIKALPTDLKGEDRFIEIEQIYKKFSFHPIENIKTGMSFIIILPFFLSAFLFFQENLFLFKNTGLLIHDLSVSDGLFFGSNILPVLIFMVNFLDASYKYKDSISIKHTYLLTSLVICMLIYNMPLCMTLYWATNSTFSFLGNFKS